MDQSQREYRIAIWHGENRSVYYVLSVNPQNEEEWECEASFLSLDHAENLVRDFERGNIQVFRSRLED